LVDERRILININIIYEDNHLLVVEKPVNVLTQGDITGDKDLLTILKEDIKERYNKPGNVFLGLVHRLDRPVGGVMVYAKTSKAASRLSEQIRIGGFKKVIKSHLFNLHQPISMEDHGYAIVEYMNGAVGVIEVSSVSKNNPYVSKLEITGTNGSIVIINDKVTYWNVEGYDMPDFTDDMDAFEKQLRDFKEAIEYNREPLVNGDNGKIAVELVNEIYLQQSYFNNILGG
jgi:hypothetical protein